VRLSAQDAIRAAIEAGQRQSHTNLPGIVVSYNAATKRADVQPALNRLVPTEIDGEFTSEKLPVIPDVPVMWPAGGGSWFQGDLLPGEGVLLVCCEADPSEYLRRGSVSDPADVRRASLAHAVAIPGLRADGSVIPASPAAAIGGVLYSAAVAERVFQFAQLLITGLNAAAGAPQTGTSLSAIITAALTGMSAPVVPGVAGAFGSAALKLGS
jgi:hypothetical protein